MNMTNDLSTMIKRLSILATIKPTTVARDGDDEADDDDDDDEDVDDSDEANEEENVGPAERKPSVSDSRPVLSKQTSIPKLSSSGSSSSSIHAHEGSKHEKSQPTFYSNREIRTSGSNLVNIQEKEEVFAEDIENDLQLGYNHDTSHSTISNSTALPFSEQLTIKTEFLGNYSNQKSPRARVIELGNQLELQKAENLKLKEALTALRNNLEPRNRELVRQNQELMNDLNFNKRLIKELKETTDTNQHEALRGEIRSLNDRLAASYAANTQIKSEIDRLKKFEDIVKSMKLVDVNKSTYQLLGQVGEGGFSKVYHCISLGDLKNYALKKVDLAVLDTENIDSIMNEIQLLKRLQSTNKVVQLVDYEFLRDKKTLNIVMELGSIDLNGFFKKEIQKHKCVPEPTRVYYWKKMLEAVDAIHKEGVIHSDIKPSNFLVVGCEVKLIDFNISNTVSDRTSVTMGFDCGTVHYMAPEQLMSDSSSKTKVTKKTDVWSLAVILYLMTYGRLPLGHLKNQYKVMHSICDIEKREFRFEPVNNLDLLDVLKKCFRHDQSERYSVEELLRHRYITGHSE